MNILILASTFPVSDSDHIPDFVKKQVIAMKQVRPDLQFSVLAPNDSLHDSKQHTKHDAFEEFRFRYFLPGHETLASRGIMPAVQSNALNYFVVPFLFVGQMIAISRFVHKHKPDLIYAHWFTPQMVSLWLVSLWVKTPVVFTTHASDVSIWSRFSLLGTFIVRRATNRATAFTAVSSRSMAKLQAFFSETELERLHKMSAILPMGTDLPPNGSDRRRKDTILFIGRLAEKKGVHYLLRSFSEIATDHPNLVLTIAGDGPWLTKLQKQAQDLGLKDTQVVFTGYVSGTKKTKLLQENDLYVVPSIITEFGDAEGLPVSLMEGLAYGKICIATNESGADDILTDSVDGFLVPQKNVGALTNSLRAALQLSPAQKETMIDNAHQTAVQFSWPTVAAEHIKFLFHGAKNG